MTILTDTVLGRAPTTNRFAPVTRGQLFAEVMHVLVDMSDPDSADSEAWSQCLEEMWPKAQPELSRASAWAIVGRITRLGLATKRAHEIRTRTRSIPEEK